MARRAPEARLDQRHLGLQAVAASVVLKHFVRHFLYLPCDEGRLGPPQRCGPTRDTWAYKPWQPVLCWFSSSNFFFICPVVKAD